MTTTLPPSGARIYARQLFAKRHGYALWCPEPYGSSSAYVATGVSIGDVGYVTDNGGFETLFNICLDASHPLNYKGVPENFEVLHIPEDRIDRKKKFHRTDTKIVSEVHEGRSVGAGASTSEAMCVNFILLLTCLQFELVP